MLCEEDNQVENIISLKKYFYGCCTWVNPTTITQSLWPMDEFIWRERGFYRQFGKESIAITVKAEETNLMLSTQIKGEQHAFKDTLLEEGTGMWHTIS